MRGQLSGGLPDSLHWHKLGRVRRQSVQFDKMTVGTQPSFPFIVQSVARRIIDDQKHLPTSISSNKLTQEFTEGVRVENRGEPVAELRLVKRYGTEDVGSFAQAVGVNPRLNSHPRPSPVQAAVLPKTGFVFEDNYSAAAGRFFLMAGRRFRNQISCASISARARRLRGRWTEKPSWCSSRGT